MGASIAHLAERSAVNRKVVGSSPTGSDYGLIAQRESISTKRKRCMFKSYSNYFRQDSVVVITSVLHAEGRGFNSHS